MIAPQRPTIHAETPPALSETGIQTIARSISVGPLSPRRPPASFSRSTSTRSGEKLHQPRRPASSHSSRQSSSDSLSSATTASSLTTPSPATEVERELEREEDLLQVVYTSSAYSRHITITEIRSILQASRSNNESKDITGLLLYRDGSFAQFLEGPASAVDALYQKIERDPRHRGIIRVLRQPATKRDFSRWSMAFRDLDMIKNRTAPSGHSRDASNSSVGAEASEASSNGDLADACDGFNQLMNFGLKVGDHTDAEYRPDAYGNAKIDLPLNMSAPMRKLVTTFYRLLDRPL
ncbi:BLUF-domain-containing protein [Testicularia cyperi]|uniref:BLUF-domain-containing protein n=1 Tax=Testicularia cyperi TaxID=1882483 RepID=A0A317XX52_9BASI|nr:BLUF-domain-containing protein [Testicularia cyperi]